MLNRDFKEFAEVLNAKGVEYLIAQHPRVARLQNESANQRRLKDLADLESVERPEEDGSRQ